VSKPLGHDLEPLCRIAFEQDALKAQLYSPFRAGFYAAVRVIARDNAAVCVMCNGNDAGMPCAYPGEKKQGCLRDARLTRDALPPTVYQCVCGATFSTPNVPHTCIAKSK
jgi:hypothetical protein